VGGGTTSCKTCVPTTTATVAKRTPRQIFFSLFSFKETFSFAHKDSGEAPGEGAPPPTSAVYKSTTPTYATCRLSLRNKGHMEKHTTCGSQVLKSGATETSNATGVVKNNADFAFCQKSVSVVYRDVWDDVWTTVTVIGLNSQGRGKTSLRTTSMGKQGGGIW